MNVWLFFVFVSSLLLAICYKIARIEQWYVNSVH